MWEESGCDSHSEGDICQSGTETTPSETSRCSPGACWWQTVTILVALFWRLIWSRYSCSYIIYIINDNNFDLSPKGCWIVLRNLGMFSFCCGCYSWCSMITICICTALKRSIVNAAYSSHQWYSFVIDLVSIHCNLLCAKWPCRNR